MSDTSLVITIGYTALSIIFVVIGLVVFRSTRVGFRVNAAGREKLEKREGYWGVAVVAFLVVVLGGTILQIPYWKSDRAGKVPPTVNVTGRQFAWTVNPPRLRIGLKTRFKVQSADVAHGLGVHDPDDVLIKQVNVGPGVQQDFIITFTRAGTYKLRCLEFCGVDHHLMENKMEVTR